MAMEVDLQATKEAISLEELKKRESVRIQAHEEDVPKQENSKEQDLPPCSYWKLYSTVDVYDKLLIAAGLIGAAGGGAMLPLFSIVFGEFINAFGDPESADFMGTTRDLALKFVYLAIGGFIAMYMEVTCFVLAGERQTNRLRAKYLTAVLRQDIAFFDTTATTGGLLQGLNEDSLAVQSAISQKASNFVHHLCTFITGFAIAFSYGWSMTLVMLGVLPFLALAGGVIGWTSTLKAKADSDAYRDASSIAQQAIASVRTVMAYNAQDNAQRAYAAALEKPVKEGVKSGLLVALGFGGLQFVMYISYAVGLLYGAFRIIDGEYTGGTVVLVNIATLMASFALGQAAPSLAAFGAGRAAGAKMFHIIERVPGMVDAEDQLSSPRSSNDTNTGKHAALPAPPTHDTHGNGYGAGHTSKDTVNGHSSPAVATPTHAAAAGHDPVKDGALSDITVTTSLTSGGAIAPYQGTGELTQVKGRIDLVDVCFAYPARPDVQVFKGFTLEVPAGQTVALVGASGSGKSTAIQLIERFYDPLSGRVLLDGVDLRCLKMSFLRKYVGLVSQEPTLFATTIYENIALGKEGATEEEVIHAAMAANAHKFIHLLPDGYYTQVGERGVQMSGGQKQRIAIARAILKNPKVLLLDEATSALDTQSERVVQAALDKMVVGRTTVVVAHRLSTIKHAHRICVVANGAVGEQGTHDKLLENPNGMYSALVRMQMQLAEQGANQGQVVEAEEGVAEDEELGEDHSIVITQDNIQQVLSGARASSAGGAIPSLPSDPANTARVSLSRDSGSGALQAQSGSQPRGPSRLSIQAAGGSTGNVVGSQQGPGSGTGGPLSRLRGSTEVARVSVTRNSTELGTKVTIDKGDDPDAKRPISEKEQEKIDEEKAKSVPFSRLLALNKPEWLYLVMGVLGSIGAGLQHPALAFVFSDMVKIFFYADYSELRKQAIFYCMMFIVIAFGALFTCIVQQFCLGYAGAQLARRVRSMLLAAILKQEVAFFDDDQHSSGRLTGALATDATYVRGAVADAAAVAMQNLSTLAIGYLIAFAYNWQMALVITATFPVLIGAMIIQMQFAMGSSSVSDKLYQGANQYITEAFASIRVIQAYNLQGYISHKYAVMLDATRPTLNKQAHFGGLGMGFSFAMMFALYALIVWFGGWQLDTGNTDFEGFLKGFMSILLAAMGMAQAGAAFPDLGKAKGAVGRIFPVLDRVPAIDVDDPKGERLSDDSVKGDVRFYKIKFAYPSRPSVIVYNDFSLDIPAGKVYALVGESGSGKSTVVSLLERFYDPLDGTVFMDGRDIKQYNLKWLRKHIGLVSQEPILFAGSIADNIRYGMDREVTSDELEAAARVANAIEFINKLPEAMNTRVGEGGIQLSGGQKQRIAIARAVLKNPKVLLLDEATSALDARSERLVQDALDVVMLGRTCLVIAHRLSTIKNANCICVLYRGTVLEQGTHTELMAIPDGAYAKLVAAQEKAHGQK